MEMWKIAEFSPGHGNVKIVKFSSEYGNAEKMNSHLEQSVALLRVTQSHIKCGQNNIQNKIRDIKVNL